MDAPLQGCPSGVAGDRLASRLRSDVADVRVRLEEAVLRSDALLATGQPERAAAVLDEQQVLLAELRETLSSSVAAALVEAEAESVLAGSPDAPDLFGTPVQDAPDLCDSPDIPVQDEAPPRRTVRATASAVVSAVAALALLIVAAPTPSPDVLNVRDRAGAADRAPSSPLLGSPDRPAAAEDDADARVTGPDEARRPSGPAAPPHDGEDTGRLGIGLSQFQALVDQFVATVVRAAGSLVPGTLPAIIDDATAGSEGAPTPADRAEGAATPDDAAADDRGTADASQDRPGTATAEEPPRAEDEGGRAEDEGGEDPVLPLPPQDEGGHASLTGIPGGE